MILPILQYPADEKSLRAPCREVTADELASDEFRARCEDLAEAMVRYDGVGLAAPQVGWHVRVITLRLSPSHQSPPIVLVNPEIVTADGRAYDKERCLSFWSVATPVAIAAPTHVTVRATWVITGSDGALRGFERPPEEHEFNGEDSVTKELRARDRFVSRALSHEIDHLHGRLLVDRVPLKMRKRFVRDVVRAQAGRAA